MGTSVVGVHVGAAAPPPSTLPPSLPLPPLHPPSNSHQCFVVRPWPMQSPRPLERLQLPAGCCCLAGRSPSWAAYRVAAMERPARGGEGVLAFCGRSAGDSAERPCHHPPTPPLHLWLPRLRICCPGLGACLRVLAAGEVSPSPTRGAASARGRAVHGSWRWVSGPACPRVLPSSLKITTHHVCLRVTAEPPPPLTITSDTLLRESSPMACRSSSFSGTCRPPRHPPSRAARLENTRSNALPHVHWKKSEVHHEAPSCVFAMSVTVACKQGERGGLTAPHPHPVCRPPPFWVPDSLYQTSLVPSNLLAGL
jgi:hypothetical protein